MFSRDQIATLAAVLKWLPGGFILAINDVPEIRKLFAWAKVEEVELLYSIAGGKRRPARELIISGGRPSGRSALG